MKFSRSIVLAVALIFAWATAGFAAHSAEICQKRIESFNYLVDYSGSMMMNFPSVGKTKMAVAKEVIKRVNDMVPELGYQGGLYTFAPYGAVVNQGPWVRSTLAAGVDSLKDNLETFARFTPMGPPYRSSSASVVPYKRFRRCPCHCRHPPGAGQTLSSTRPCSIPCPFTNNCSPRCAHELAT